MPKRPTQQPVREQLRIWSVISSNDAACQKHIEHCNRTLGFDACPSCDPSTLFDGPKLGIFCHHNQIPGASEKTGAQNSDTPPKLVPFRKLGAPRQEEQKCHM